MPYVLYILSKTTAALSLKYVIEAKYLYDVLTLL